MGDASLDSATKSLSLSNEILKRVIVVVIALLITICVLVVCMAVTSCWSLISHGSAIPAAVAALSPFVLPG